MKDTFWTPELWCEFLNQRPLIGALETEMEQFKSSKAPKKEWEIVAYGEKLGNDINIYRLQNDGRYKSESHPNSKLRWPRHSFNGNHEFIHSVRRLSDGEVFSVEDRIKPTPTAVRNRIIKSFSVTGDVLKIHDEDGYFYAGETYWHHMVKLPQPILTTLDGVQVFEDREVTVVYTKDHSYSIGPLSGYHPDTLEGNLVFADDDKAQAYILQNRPLLSLNDVKESANATVKDYWLLMEALSIKVKQKLNP